MNLKELLGALSISGGWAGLMAFTLSIWVIVYWFMDECSYDKGVNCKTPASQAARSDQRNVMFIVAWIAVIPSIWVMVLALKDKIKKRR